MSTDAEKLLEQIKKVRYPNRDNRFYRPKKRKNESDRDYVFRINGYRCRYTNRRYPKNKLSLITLEPRKMNIPKYKNMGVACTDFALMKGGMSDNEFRDFLSKRKKEIRQEAYQLSREIKEKVFKKNECIYCEHEYGYTPKGRKLTIDHKIPIAKGGTNDIERDYKNLACACEQHNFEKGAMTASQFFNFLDKRKNGSSINHKKTV